MAAEAWAMMCGWERTGSRGQAPTGGSGGREQRAGGGNGQQGGVVKSSARARKRRIDEWAGTGKQATGRGGASG